MTLTAYSQREIYNHYQALLSSPRYFDKPGRAAVATVEGCRVTKSTVYRALRQMQQQVS